MRRYVAMHEPQRRAVEVGQLVRVVQTGERIDDQPQVKRQRDLVISVRGHEVIERDAVQVLHHDDVSALLLTHLVGLHHVGVAKARGEARLGEEALDEVGVLGELLSQNLEDEELVEPRLAAHDGQEDGGHPPLSELGEQRVAPQRAPDSP